jgi:metallophosphoesterase (TIGR00282 family)
VRKAETPLARAFGRAKIPEGGCFAAATRLSCATLRILFIADVVGAPGRKALEERLAGLRSELEVDACVVNGENAADGIGITPRLADQILGMGVDAITLGNHAFRRSEIGAYLEASGRVIRPANTSRNTPGRGATVVSTASGQKVGVINVLGSLFLHPATSMFELIDELVEETRRETPVVLVDVHAEATSEKAAMARWLDGRVTAVVGTHTHVQTSDATVLPKGTAFITDAGMTGPHDSVIGVEAELAIRRMRTGLPVRFETAQGGVRIEGALVECNAETGKASSIEAVRVRVS